MSEQRYDSATTVQALSSEAGETDRSRGGGTEVGELFASLDSMFGQTSEKDSSQSENTLDIRDALTVDSVVLAVADDAEEEQPEAAVNMPAISLFQEIGASGDGNEPARREAGSSDVALSFDPFFSEPPHASGPASADVATESAQPEDANAAEPKTGGEPQPSDRAGESKAVSEKPSLGEASKEKEQKLPAEKPLKSRYADVPVAKPAGISTEEELHVGPGGGPAGEPGADEEGLKGKAASADTKAEPSAKSEKRSDQRLPEKPAEKRLKTSGEKPSAKTTSKSAGRAKPVASASAGGVPSQPKVAAQVEAGSAGAPVAAGAATGRLQAENQISTSNAAEKHGESEAESKAEPSQRSSAIAAAPKQPPSSSAAATEQLPVPYASSAGPVKSEQNAAAAIANHPMPETAPVRVRPAIEQEERKDKKAVKKAAGTALVILALACVVCTAVMLSMGANRTQGGTPSQAETGQTAGEGAAGNAEAGTETYRYSVAGPDGSMCQTTEKAQFNEQGVLEKSTITVELASPEQAEEFLETTKLDFGDAFLDGSVGGSTTVVEVKATAEDMTREAYAAVLKKNAADFESI